jgi:hypothetical protein
MQAKRELTFQSYRAHAIVRRGAMFKKGIKCLCHVVTIDNPYKTAIVDTPLNTQITLTSTVQFFVDEVGYINTLEYFLKFYHPDKIPSIEDITVRYSTLENDPIHNVRPKSPKTSYNTTPKLPPRPFPSPVYLPMKRKNIDEELNESLLVNMLKAEIFSDDPDFLNFVRKNGAEAFRILDAERLKRKLHAYLLKHRATITEHVLAVLNSKLDDMIAIARNEVISPKVVRALDLVKEFQCLETYKRVRVN